MKTDNIEDIKNKIDDIYGVTTYWVDDGFGFQKNIHEFNVNINGNRYNVMYINKKDNKFSILLNVTFDEMLKEIDKHLKRKIYQIRLF